MPRIINTVFVHEDAAHQTAQIEHRVRIPAISSQARCLNGKHRTHAPLADQRQQPLESSATCTCARHSQILVDDDNLGKGQRPGSLSQCILTPATLRVVLQLPGRGLAIIPSSELSPLFRVLDYSECPVVAGYYLLSFNDLRWRGGLDCSV